LGAGASPDYEGPDDTSGVSMLMLRKNYDGGRFIKMICPSLMLTYRWKK
jgi:hypothetical protein